MLITDLIKHSITLNMEIVSMIAEEVQQKAESYVKANTDEAYETFLNQLINGVEKTVDMVATPVEAIVQQVQGLNPNSDVTQNWNDALKTLHTRIQDLKKAPQTEPAEQAE